MKNLIGNSMKNKEVSMKNLIGNSMKNLIEKYLGEEKLYQRGTDGYPIGADNILKKAYGKIPDSDKFQKGYGYEKPIKIDGWAWSTTFNRWTALVTFKDGSKVWTYPK